MNASRAGSIATIASTYSSGFQAGEFAGVDEAQTSVRQYARKLRQRGLDSEARCVEQAAKAIWRDFNSKAVQENDIKELDKDSLLRLI